LYNVTIQTLYNTVHIDMLVIRLYS